MSDGVPGFAGHEHVHQHDVHEHVEPLRLLADVEGHLLRRQVSAEVDDQAPCAWLVENRDVTPG